MLKFMKQYGYPVDLDLDVKYDGEHPEIIVYVDGKEIDRFKSNLPLKDRKSYARGYLMALGYKI